MANSKFRILDGLYKRLIDWGDDHVGEHVAVTAVDSAGNVAAMPITGPLTDAEMRASDVAVTLDGEKVLIDEDSLPASLTETTVTVAQGESESGEVDLAGAATVMIYPPAAVEATTAQMSFKVGRVTGSRAQLNDEYGVKLVIPFTAAQPIRVPASMLPAVRFLSIVLETSGGAAVAQATAAREFVFVTRRV